MENARVEALRAWIFDVVRKEILAVGDDFGPESPLLEYGLDSLAITQLLLAIEENTGVWIEESALTPENFESCATLARCVHARLSSG